MTRKLTSEEQARCVSVMDQTQEVAARMARRNPSFRADELEAVANAAIVEAVFKFDPQLSIFKKHAHAVATHAMLEHVRGTLQKSGRERRLARFFQPGPTTDEEMRLEDAFTSTPESDRSNFVDTLTPRLAGSIVVSLERASPTDAEDAHLDLRRRAYALQLLQEVVPTLEEPDRTIYQRYFRDQATLEQIAEELGKSMRTVQRYVDRIKTKLVPFFKQARLVDKAV